ncbi:HEPN domain-containing protein [Romeria aff. gracilis LEGE 07310]|uniref:HEPN domain-containing protein n=1 Tax=Vasconcelosia minhoensis LEGE 07310 TaxID=915328 RepID=A0A8J7AQR5_9CYAN|nr:HEPN domain-containing protein [Romeria gracilis]MBE9078909.1 HEPN domain-containing protein [Romeria aff. gracilis LEGE 07310]
MSDLKQARMLLLVAQRDLRALRGMIDASVFADEVFGFHAQQSAEKALKAWLATLGDVYPQTHDLGVLLQRLENYECEVTEFWELLELNPFAVQMRYDLIETDDLKVNRDDLLKRIELLENTVKSVIDSQPENSSILSKPT